MRGRLLAVGCPRGAERSRLRGELCDGLELARHHLRELLGGGSLALGVQSLGFREQEAEYQQEGGAPPPGSYFSFSFFFDSPVMTGARSLGVDRVRKRIPKQVSAVWISPAWRHCSPGTPVHQLPSGF
jgi:hypothetical protein